MIDEKKLIEDLLHDDGIEFQMDFDCTTEEAFLRSINEFIDNMKNGIVNLINAQPKVGDGWIRVSERLPERFGEYIVAVKANDGTVYSDYADYDPFQKRWTTGLYRSPTEVVIQWMPMPEPPKDGGGA